MNFLFYILMFVAITSGGNGNEHTKWMGKYSEAERVAREEDKPLLLFFSGSDWCKPCIKLKKYIVDTKQFQELASNKFVLYNADFPINKKQEKEIKEQNEALAEKYNKEGLFPKIVIVSTGGDVLAEIGYIDCTPDEYFGMILSKVENRKSVRD
ncbi:MAG: thioredoxin family protein [Prolixibacteraceae bacterium]|nr:thioredoxin family protein [Prolixibacteraceae bacterium]